MINDGVKQKVLACGMEQQEQDKASNFILLLLLHTISLKYLRVKI